MSGAAKAPTTSTQSTSKALRSIQLGEKIARSFLIVDRVGESVGLALQADTRVKQRIQNVDDQIDQYEQAEHGK